MRLLLDTHAFLWSLIEPPRLSPAARAALTDPANAVLVSAVSFWEVAIKFRLGKLDLSGIQPGQLPAEATKAGYQLVSLDPDAAATSHELSSTVHRDPFDRLLVWQAIRNDWALVSRDRAMSGYEQDGLKLIW